MSDTKLGQLLDSTATRDAIHIAIAPVIAAHSLVPGAHVGLNEKGEALYTASPIGIVDPFLAAMVKAGERFYLCLYQQTVTDLRHHWQHPAFNVSAQRPTPPVAALAADDDDYEDCPC